MQFKYLSKIAGKKINNLREIFEDRRLCKHLWIEFILNPEIIKVSQRHLKEPLIKAELLKAISWYFAFRWLFKENPVIERLKKKKILTPYPVRGEVYRKDCRSFLKGITYACLC